jgi:hypothetical protein
VSQIEEVTVSIMSCRVEGGGFGRYCVFVRMLYFTYMLHLTDLFLIRMSFGCMAGDALSMCVGVSTGVS